MLMVINHTSFNVLCVFTILAKAPGCPCVFELHNVVWDWHVPGEEMAVHRDNAPEFSITKKTVSNGMSKRVFGWRFL